MENSGSSVFLKNFIFRSVAILLGLLLGFATVEILARFLYQKPWYEKVKQHQKLSEKYPYVKNSDGLRDIEYPNQKDLNHRRILILGDSFTFGLGVPNVKDTFPEILENILNRDTIKKTEVLNGGLPGSFPSAWLNLYKQVGEKFDPDIVVIVFFLRCGTAQYTIPTFFQRIEKEINFRNRKSWLYQRFIIYRFIKNLLDRSMIVKEYTEDLENSFLGNSNQTRAWHRAQKDLRVIKTLAHKNSTTVGFVVFPILAELDEEYPFGKIMEHVEEFAIENGFPVHNLLPSFSGHYGPDLWVSAYDQHPNEKAHYIAAESMLPFVKKLLSVHEKPDEDNDGICNQETPDSSCTGSDNCRYIFNPDQEDSDGDHVGNVCDNCPNEYNPDQTDTDEDEMGDMCDNCTDTDSDGYGNPGTSSNCDEDNCPTTVNPDQKDDDGDGLGNACDICPDDHNPDQSDYDKDGVGDACDICPDDYNPDQSDYDKDGTGDVLDGCTDTDKDGYGNPGFSNTCGDDNCPYAFNPGQEDGDEDGIGDACESEFEDHWLEAEHAQPMMRKLEVAEDEDASQGKYIYAPNGTGDQYAPGSAMAIYMVNISQAGQYVLWGNVSAANKSDDSFFVQVDSGADNLWELEPGNYWHWDAVNNRNKSDPVKFILTKGLHKIKIKLREDGTKLDKILLTNNISFVPSGKGNSEEN